ncbi:hypothetical protein Pfo_001836, partial [Paulownia fortunei]
MTLYYFECSCECGKDEKHFSERIPMYQKPTTRIKCKAKLRITREKWGEWKVGKFVMEHNHEMVATDQTHLLRSSCNISHAQKSTLEAMNVQLDDDKRVMNFFFRDYRCWVDYEYFGDVLSDDTTYRTNRYNLIYAPFVGINHHKQNVMFGLAFMLDEIESSFEWLFRTFLDSMSGKQPEIFFTDQCQVMMNAVEMVFPCAHNHLCNLNGDSNFKKLWHKCMSHYESEEEIEATWKKIIIEYNLSGHKWLNGMYKLRHKWATAFSNRKFSARLLATSRSESTNSMKIARHRVSDEIGESRSESGHVSQMVFVNQTMRSTYDSSSQQINALFEDLSLDDQNVCDDLVVDEDNDRINEVLIRSPRYVKLRRITNTHIVRHWDDKNKKGKEKEKGKGKGKVESSSKDKAHKRLFMLKTHMKQTIFHHYNTLLVILFNFHHLYLNLGPTNHI